MKWWNALPESAVTRFATSTIAWKTSRRAKQWAGKRSGTSHQRRLWLHTNLCRRLERNKAVAQIVQRSACGLKALRKRIEDFGDIVFVSETMVARGPETRATNLFVIPYVRRAFPFRPHANAIRKDAGQKERIIAHVGADEKAGEVVGG